MYGRGKNQPVEDESASDWDTESEMSTAQKAPQKGKKSRDFSSGEDMPVRDAPSKSKANKAQLFQAGDSKSRQSTPKKKQQDTSNKNNGRNVALNHFTFADRGMDSEEEVSQMSQVSQVSQKSTRSDRHRKQRQKQKEKQSDPPYNFKDALKEEREPEDGSELRDPRPTGKTRKGQTYDPPATARSDKSEPDITISNWDDSEAEEQTLAQLRNSFRQPSPAASPEPPPNPKPQPAKQQKQQPKTQPKTQSQPKRQSPPEEQKNIQSNGPVPQESNIKEDKLNQSRTSWKSFEGLGNKLANKFNKSPRQDHQSTEMLVEVKGQEPQAGISNLALDLDGPPANTNLSMELAPTKTKSSKLETIIDTDKYTYYFEEGHNEYFRAGGERQQAAMTRVADKVEVLMQRGFQEFFGVLRIIVTFAVLLVVELYKFVLRYIFQPLVIGVLVTSGDHVIKPLFSAIFNGFIQPTLILLWNSFVGLRNALGPVIDILRGLAQLIALILKAFRLVDVNLHRHQDGYHQGAVQNI